MKKVLSLFLLFSVFCFQATAQVYNQIDETGQITQRNENGNFNKLHNDTTKKNKEVPKGLYVWSIDRIFGDVRSAVPDTVPHLYMNTIFNTGVYGEYNSTGNNYSPRINRIVADRPLTSQFHFVQPYSYVMKEPDNFHFTNTLSPITNISYDECGDKQYGEDHIRAKFAVNAGKRLGLGFDLNYAYARGYYSGQSTSHFGAILYASYLGDNYNMHVMFSNYHQKVTENGGITDDNYVTHPEMFQSSFTENEIPTVLSSNWNRNNSNHLFFSHRYNLGFYRKVKMTDAEIKARKFAAKSIKDKEKREREKKSEGEKSLGRQTGRGQELKQPAGRPKGTKVIGIEPVKSDSVQMDTTRIKVESKEMMDSLLSAKAIEDSIAATMKDEYVPVTSFIHTLDLSSYDRIYQSYQSPVDYYANKYFVQTSEGKGGGVGTYDQDKLFSVRNTAAIALLEGFNKYAKAGLKVFAAHEYRRFKMPEFPVDSISSLGSWVENTISVGGQINKTQGKTLHYNLMAETWLVGKDAGQLKVNFSTDLNFPLFGDTVTLAAKAYFYRLKPTFFQRNYHSKYLWWDKDFDMEIRTKLEGLFHYRKTDTRLRVSIEEIQNYMYFGMSYNTTSTGRTALMASAFQSSANINLLTMQLMQNVRLGILNWENILTYQNCNHEDVLPVPTFNLYTNLYLKFKIVRQLSVELGADMYFFTKYNAPDYCPQIGQYAVQQNENSRVKIGGYPFVDVYANMHLKHARFFVMFSHVNGGSGSREYFLTPHYPQNLRIMRMGVSWNFFN